MNTFANYFYCYKASYLREKATLQIAADFPDGKSAAEYGFFNKSYSHAVEIDCGAGFLIHSFSVSAAERGGFVADFPH